MTENETAEDYADPMARMQLGLAADVLRSFGGACGGRHLALIGGMVPPLLGARLENTMRKLQDRS